MVINNSTINLDGIVMYPIHDKFGELDRNFKPGDYFKHFKNHLCQFVGWAMHTETEEPLAVYECISNGQRKMFARPKDMFLSKVDREKYPDVDQEYRMVKVYLEKKSASTLVTTLTLTPETAMSVLDGVRQFLHSYNPDQNEIIQFWIAGADSTATIKMQRPTSYINILNNIHGEASIQQTIKFGRTIQFQTDTASEAIKQGDTVHFVGDNRMVIENKEENLYEFFEIVPDIRK